jgi:hypothetical protein
MNTQHIGTEQTIYSKGSRAVSIVKNSQNFEATLYVNCEEGKGFFGLGDRTLVTKRFLSKAGAMAFAVANLK